MRLELFNESHREIIRQWKKDYGELNEIVEKSKPLIDLTKPHLVYMVYVEEDPVGSFGIYHIEPNEKAELGVIIPIKKSSLKVAKLLVAFLMACFEEYGFEYIYGNHLTEHAEKAAEYIGFHNGIITYEDLRKRWSKWDGQKRRQVSPVE